MVHVSDCSVKLICNLSACARQPELLTWLILIHKYMKIVVDWYFPGAISNRICGWLEEDIDTQSRLWILTVQTTTDREVRFA